MTAVLPLQYLFQRNNALYSLISAKAGPQLNDYLMSIGCDILHVETSGIVSEPVSCHADIFYCQICGNVFAGDPELLGSSYPSDVLYNAAAVGKYLICSKFTSPELTERSGLIPIVVPQGYVKCNLLVVDSEHVITEDRGICNVLEKKTDIHCLLIEPHHVMLEGYDYGFIGGASGTIGRTVIFNGNITAHPSYKKIADFIKACNMEIKYFDSYPLTDIGSILFSTSFPESL